MPTFSYPIQTRVPKQSDWPKGSGTTAQDILTWGANNPTHQRTINVDDVAFSMYVDGSVSLVMSADAFNPSSPHRVQSWFLDAFHAKTTAVLYDLKLVADGSIPRGVRLGKIRLAPVFVIGQQVFDSLGLKPTDAYTIFKYDPPCHSIKVHVP